MSSDDNPGKSTGEDLATIAFKEMDVNSDGMVRMTDFIRKFRKLKIDLPKFMYQVTQEEFLRACLAHEKISTMLALRIIDVFITDSPATSDQS